MPIGTANGIRKTLSEFNDEAFVVVNADIWTNYLFVDLNYQLVENCLAHIILAPKPIYSDGDFDIIGKSIAQGNKYTYTGIGVYSPKLFTKYKDKELGDILKKEKNINAEIYLGLWDDIGTPERLNAARKTISL
jgi:MurNAc alpha-1-phosphate uridylyltransferase